MVSKAQTDEDWGWSSQRSRWLPWSGNLGGGVLFKNGLMEYLVLGKWDWKKISSQFWDLIKKNQPKIPCLIHKIINCCSIDKLITNNRLLPYWPQDLHNIPPSIRRSLDLGTRSNARHPIFLQTSLLYSWQLLLSSLSNLATKSLVENTNYFFLSPFAANSW